MHDHMMDTSEAPTPALREGVNGGGALVISTSMQSSNMNTKILHVTPASSEPIILNSIPNHVNTSTTILSNQAHQISSTTVAPFSSTTTSFSPPTSATLQSNCIARTSQNDIANSVAPQIQVLNKKTAGLTVLQNSHSNHNHVNHGAATNNHQASVRTTIPSTTSLPNFTQQPPTVSVGNHVRNMQNQVTIQGSFIHLQQQHQPAIPTRIEPQQQPSSVSVITSTIGSSVIQSLPHVTVLTATTNGLPEGNRHQRFNHCPPQMSTPSVDLQIKPMSHQLNVPSAPLNNGQTSVSTGGSNGQKAKQLCENQRKYEDDSSDTDMEIKSLELSSMGNTAQKCDKGRQERPMSWEGELSDSDLKKIIPQEEQMRVEAEEPMSPMSPCSDNDQDTLSSQIKSEDVSEDQNHHHAVFTTHTLPPTDSPVPARSDSGCELHLGPFTPTQSPLLPRIHSHQHSPTHLYSPTQSPSQSRHLSGFSSPYSHSPSTGLSRNNSDASQYGGSYNSYSSAPSPISPTHYSPSQSPNLGRIIGSIPGGTNHGCFLGGPIDLRDHHSSSHVGHYDGTKELKEDDRLSAADLAQHSVLAAQSGITRQQLINSPCPICGDKISGFHYGIFSCESCKGFFKRTVQNKKNYVCMRGSSCPVTIATRKKCPACRFEKCLRKGMKLEAIREDRTRGGRSTYQCAPYTLPPSLVSPSSSGISLDQTRISDGASVKSEPQDGEDVKPSSSRERPPVPILLQQIHDVEHLWHCSEAEMSQIRQADAMAREAMESDSADCVSMCKIAEGRLYKIVKWCKSLPLFRHISIDDQIILLMNSWCELLLLSCCFRSMDTSGEIRVSSGKTMSLAQAESMGIGPCIERMLNLSYQLRRLQVDRFEYMAMKVIVLLTSDVAGLKEGEKVRYSQGKVVQALEEYTLSHYPHIPSKFGELLLRIPELQRTCHASKEMLSVKKKEGDVPSFNFLFELLRGDH